MLSANALFLWKTDPQSVRWALYEEPYRDQVVIADLIKLKNLIAPPRIPDMALTEPVG